jgi:glycerol-3-phosphate acyltransferase PlsY
VAGVIVAYLLGSFPSAYLAGLSRGIDLRQHGSGNLGATNVVRVLGAKIGALVFLADILKGFLPVFFLPRFVPSAHAELFALVLGVAAIVGHVKPVYLRGKGGGKGVATAAGVFLGIAWLPATIAFLVWLLVFLVWRYVSLASLVAAAVLPLAFWATGWPVRDIVFGMSVALAAFVFYTHRANIGRLWRGEEHNFRRKRGSTNTDASTSANARVDHHASGAAPDQE